MQQGFDIIMIFLLVLAVSFVALLTIYKVIPFLEERKYIKMEIKRTTGKEKKYWQKQLKKLYFGVFTR